MSLYHWLFSLQWDIEKQDEVFYTRDEWILIYNNTDDVEIVHYPNGRGKENAQTDTLLKTEWSSLVLKFSLNKLHNNYLPLVQQLWWDSDIKWFAILISQICHGLLGEQSEIFVSHEHVYIKYDMVSSILESDTRLELVISSLHYALSSLGSDNKWSNGYWPCPYFIEGNTFDGEIFGEYDFDGQSSLSLSEWWANILYDRNRVDTIKLDKQEKGNSVKWITIIDAIEDLDGVQLKDNGIVVYNGIVVGWYDMVRDRIFSATKNQCSWWVKEFIYYFFSGNADLIREYRRERIGEESPLAYARDGLAIMKLESKKKKIEAEPIEDISFGEKGTPEHMVLKKENINIEHINYMDSSIFFTDDSGVIANLVYTDAKGKMASLEKVLFRTKVKPIGITRIRDTSSLSEKTEHNVIFETNKWYITTKIHARKQSMNSELRDYGIFFYGDDNLVCFFYEALFASNDLPVYDIIQDDGHYNGYTILNGDVIYGKLPERTGIKIQAEKTPTQEPKEVSINEFVEKMLEIYNEYYVLPFFCAMIALQGMNMRDPSNTIFPAVMISGLTTNGKTTMSNICKSALWYFGDVRKLAVNSATAQPLNKWACKRSIFFLEEFTGIPAYRRQSIENAIRNIINRGMWSRWLQSGDDMNFNYRSPLLVDGEDLPGKESVQNRFMTFIVKGDLKKKHARPNDVIQELMWMTCRKEICRLYHSYGEEKINALYHKKVAELTTKLWAGRYAESWWYAFVINEILWLLDEDIFVETVREMLGIMWFIADESKASLETDSSRWLFGSTIVNIAMTRWVILSKSIIDDDKWYIYTLIFNKEKFNVNKAQFYLLIKQLGINDVSHIHVEASTIKIWCATPSKLPAHRQAYSIMQDLDTKLWSIGISGKRMEVPTTHSKFDAFAKYILDNNKKG